jgi:ketosteroid isomerase-like protein
MKKVSAIASLMILVTLQAGAQKKLQISESFVAAWNSHDVERVIPVFTDDVLYEDVAFGAVNHGSAELRKFATSIFEAVPDVKFELVSSTVN